MQGFAGVVVLPDNSVLLVNEPDYFSGETRRTFPSRHMEQGEDPANTAARELTEESGCTIAPPDLELIAIADVAHDGETISRSWNYTATTTEIALAPRVHDEEEETVTAARWFNHAEAVRLLGRSSYAPKIEPIITFLTSGERNLHWTFDLIDASTPAPTFRWDPPVPRSPEEMGSSYWPRELPSLDYQDHVQASSPEVDRRPGSLRRGWCPVITVSPANVRSWASR